VPYPFRSVGKVIIKDNPKLLESILGDRSRHGLLALTVICEEDLLQWTVKSQKLAERSPNIDLKELCGLMMTFQRFEG